MPVGREVPRTPDAPKTQPPGFTPEIERAHALGFEETPGLGLVLPNTVTPCLNEITYIWLKNKSSFWAKPIAVNQNIITCWIWNGATWYKSQIPLNIVKCFICKWF